MPQLSIRGTVVSPEARLVRSPLRQLAGLMFSKPRDLVFDLKREKRVWMHMLFVFFPIDVVLLGDSREVKALKPRFRPFRLYLSGVQARYILELKAGTILRFGISPGDRIEFDALSD